MLKPDQPNPKETLSPKKSENLDSSRDLLTYDPNDP